VGKKKLLNSTFFVIKRIGRAASRFEMLRGGSVAVVGLSGGYASMALLSGLVERQKRIPFDATFIPVHVPDRVYGPAEVVVPRLTGLCDRLGLKLVVARGEHSSDSHFAPVPHRRALLETVRDRSATSLVLGHTLADRARSAMVAMTLHGSPDILQRREMLDLAGSGDCDPHAPGPKPDASTAIETVRPLCLLVDEPVRKMAEEEALPFLEPAVAHPNAALIAEIDRFIASRKGPLTEMMANICNAPGNLQRNYMA